MVYMLFFSSEIPRLSVPNIFHWGLYLHIDARQGGAKYYVKQQGPGGWIADHANTRGVFKSFLLIGLFQIATIPTGSEAHVDHKLRTYDSLLNSLPGITCRVWLLRVLALLQEEVNGYKLLQRVDLSELEAEIKAWGNENAASAILNEQPRPFALSKYVEE